VPPMVVTSAPSGTWRTIKYAQNTSRLPRLRPF
jgi:hypothetical protein